MNKHYRTTNMNKRHQANMIKHHRAMDKALKSNHSASQFSSINPNSIDMEDEVDQRIQEFGAQFIQRIHFVQSVMTRLIRLRWKTVKGVALPSEPPLLALLQANHRDDLQGKKGLKCLAVEPKSFESFDLTIRAKKGEDHCSFECNEWEQLISKCNIQENDVVSLWLYYEEGDLPTNTNTSPGILIRVDANVKKGDPLPGLPTFAKKGFEED